MHDHQTVAVSNLRQLHGGKADVVLLRLRARCFTALE
jgi:hypothetical protein